MTTITLYSRPGCGACLFTKKHLERLGLDFQEEDIQASQAAYQAVQELGYKELPVVVAGEKSFSGYQPERLEALAQ